MCSSPQFPADLVTFTEKIINEKLHFLCSDTHEIQNSGIQNTLRFI